MVLKSQGLDKSRQLAIYYCSKAINALEILPETPAKTALIQLTRTVLERKK